MNSNCEGNCEYEGELLQRIIDTGDVRSVFQPIISLRDGSVLGYEALSRGPQGSELENPERMFAAARRNRRLWELELLCRTKALATLHRFHFQSKIFLNVNPSVIADAKFQQGFTKEYLESYQMNPQSVIFEITEKNAVENIGDFKKIIASYRQQDYKIAIDDAGAGYSGLNLISDIYPNYLKLDMNLIRDIDKDSVKRALVRGMCEFTRITGTHLIAEGIETPGELQTLIDIGVQYGQGYLIQRPTAIPSPVSAEVVGMVVEQNARKNHIYGYNLSDIYIGNLCISAPTVHETITISQAYEMLKSSERAQGFCVAREGVVQGVVTRDRLNALVGGLYGYNLYSRKCVSTVMSRDFLSVDYKTPVNTAGRLAMARPDATVYDFITVTQEGKYCGVVTIKDLLNKTIEIEVSNATQLNPLTAMPGNTLIEHKLSEALRQETACCVLYLDIDNFKAYNDVYGFENGDRVIKAVADILTHAVPERDFVGHVGGDDFVALLQAECPRQVQELCARILEEFNQSVAGFYRAEDLANGYIIAKSRRGFEEQYPLLSLSIAGLSTQAGRFADVFSLTEEASRIKKECKQKAGSCCIIV